MSLKRFITSRPLLAMLALKVWEWSDFALPVEQDFRAFEWLQLQSGLFLDVGAHVGESARSFRLYNPTTPILSIEANAKSFARLSRLENKLGRFEARRAFASDHDDHFELHVPAIDNIEFPSFGGKDRNQILERLTHDWQIDRSRVTFTTEPVESVRLDRYDLQVAVLKVDVEGHELPVVRGLMETITRNRPLILIEIDMTDFWTIARELSPLAYECMTYDHRTRRFSSFGPDHPHTSQNAWFVPELDRWQVHAHDAPAAR